MNWGIISTGSIAHLFVKDLLLLDDHTAYAVASRSLDKAHSFSSLYNMNKAYGSYSELFEDPEIEIVYVATPHDSHKDLSIQAMQAGKHVLCEKPSTVNAEQLREVLETSKSLNQFYMEAFWSRFNPALLKVFQIINEGILGDVNYINADFSFLRNDDPESRMLNMELAGGSLLDMGVYPVFLSYMILGYPDNIKASAILHETGADLQTSMLFKYSLGHAVLTSSFISESDMKARIYGTKGAITISNPWHESESFELRTGDGTTNYTVAKIGKGYTHEIIACAESISKGQIENELWSHKNSFDLISITDEVRNQINLKYPFE